MSDKSLSSIESEMEQTRERLAGTIDQLVNRASPKNIVSRQVAGVKGYFVDAQGAPRQENIVKVAAGVAGAIVVVAVLRRLTRSAR